MTKPDLLTRKQFDSMGQLEQFNRHHGSNALNWEVPCPSIIKPVSDGVLYQEYCDWYCKTFSKLGQVLG